MLHTDETTPCNRVSPELWFSDEPEKILQAKALCLSCTQKLRCLAETLETEAALGMQLHGVHGALTPSERITTTIKKIG